MPRVFCAAVAFLALVVLSPPVAMADDWDLNLSRLCMIETEHGRTLDCGGGYDQKTDGAVTRVIADNTAFRSLMSELGAVFAPNILQPSDTIGFGGFATSVEFAWTMINPHKKAQGQEYYATNAKAGDKPIVMGEHWYWRAANSVSSSAFADGNVRTAQAIERINRELPGSFAPTITVMARKGLWVPVPSVEIGVGARHLIGSRMWAPLVQAKVALHEGFHGWPLPAVAVRAMGSRVVGSPDFNLTIVGLDFSISKQFGLGGTFNITPYTGYQLLWMIADSETLDATPGVDSIAQTAAGSSDPLNWNRCNSTDCTGNFVFANQANITRHRFFIGARLNFYIASLLAEYTFFASGGKSDQLAGQAGIPGIVIPDSAGAQHSISFALQLDY
jgi:hypothetical protein